MLADVDVSMADRPCRFDQGRPEQALLPPAVQGLHHRHAQAPQDPAAGCRRLVVLRPGRAAAAAAAERDAVAQDRQDAAGGGRRPAAGVQEDPGALHKLRQAPQAGEDQLGDAPVPPRRERGGA